MSLSDLLICTFAPGIIIKGLQRQDPEKLAIHCADIVDEILDKEFKNKKSEKIQRVLVPFLNKFVMKFNQRLLDDQKGV